MNQYRLFDPKEISVPEVHRLLLSGVAPRPIALVSTMSAKGEHNLSPFSFFNTFGANPPIVAFSPAYSGKDGLPKDTFLNLKEFSEYTISIVTYSIVEQISLASTSYPRGVDEFIKAGLTKLPSVKVKPPGVSESPFVMECKLLHHIDLGGKPSSGNLMIGEVVYFHIKEEIFTDNKIDPQKIDAVARMGYDYYCRAIGDVIFRLPNPKGRGIGFDQLPEHIRTSPVLTGSDLAKLARVESLPDLNKIKESWNSRLQNESAEKFSLATFYHAINTGDPDTALEILLPEIKNRRAESELIHRLAKAYLQRGEVEIAWEVLLVNDVIHQ